MSIASPPERPATAREAQAQVLRTLAPYRQPFLASSLWQLFSTLAGFVAAWTAMLWALEVSYWLVLALAPLAAAFFVRLFIIQHDCGHRSFFRSRSANDWAGTCLSVVTMTPYHCWRKEHASHHATSGDLDRRSRGGEIYVMTVREYQQASAWTRLYYRVYRNPLVLFVLAPVLHFAIRQRLTISVPKTWKKERSSVHLTNVLIALAVAAMIWLVGWRALLLVHLPVMMLASSLGVWLFYVQHQYEETYWRWQPEWNYMDAALHGSSYYRLPRILQWFTANIGLHHIHHLDSRIPNYRLQECMDDLPELKPGKTLGVWESLECYSFKLWDEDRRCMVGFPRRGAAVHAS